MGMLIDGKWVDDDARFRHRSCGAFVWRESAFTGRATADGSSGFRAEPGALPPIRLARLPMRTAR